MIASNFTNSITNNIEFSYLGSYEYQKAENLQKDLAALVKQTKMNAIIGLEHPAVMTLGYRMQSGVFCIETSAIPVVPSSRGGLVTIHSEGQLVIYPVLDLRALKWGVKHYVEVLLRTTQKLLTHFNVESFIDEDAVGNYTAHGKIAFCGIQVRHGISQHGISLNVRNDLSLFRHIVACGINNAAMDRLQNYNVNLTLNEIFTAWVQIFKTELN